MMLTFLIAMVLLVQATDPPPLPNDQPEAPPPLPDIAGGNKMIDKYQDCIQKMIDSDQPNNSFIRKCMGFGQGRKRSSSSPGGAAQPLQDLDWKPVMDQGLPPLKQCYETLLTKSRALGLMPQGRIQANFFIQNDGRIEGLSFSVAGVNDLNFLECWRDRIERWRFPAMPHTLSVQLAFQLTAAKQATVVLADGFPKLLVAGFSSEDLFNVFQKYSKEVRACYDQLLMRKPDAAGQVGVDVTVDARGSAKRVNFRQLTLDDKPFKVCLHQSIKRWRFPKPRSGQDTLAAYPAWTFSPPQVRALPGTPPGGVLPATVPAGTSSRRPGR